MFPRVPTRAAWNQSRFGVIALLMFCVLSVPVSHAKVPATRSGSVKEVQQGAKPLKGWEQRLESTATANQPSNSSMPSALGQEASSGPNHDVPAVTNGRRPASMDKPDGREPEAYDGRDAPAAEDEEGSAAVEDRAEPTPWRRTGTVKSEAERAGHKRQWAPAKETGEPSSRQQEATAKDKHHPTAKQQSGRAKDEHRPHAGEQPGWAKDEDEDKPTARQRSDRATDNEKTTARQQSGWAKDHDEPAVHKRASAEAQDKPTGTKAPTLPVAASAPSGVRSYPASPPEASALGVPSEISVEPPNRVAAPDTIDSSPSPAPDTLTDGDAAAVPDRTAAVQAAAIPPHHAVASVGSNVETMGGLASEAAKTPAPEPPPKDAAPEGAQRLEARATRTLLQAPEARESLRASAVDVLHPTLDRAGARLEAFAPGGLLDSSTPEAFMAPAGGPLTRLSHLAGTAPLPFRAISSAMAIAPTSAIERPATDTADRGARSDGDRSGRSPSPMPVPDEPAGLLAAGSASSGGGAGAGAVAILPAIALSLGSPLTTQSLPRSPSRGRSLVLVSLTERPD